ncbi:MAG: ankyrin repeat domain-containing protein [Cyanobacteriota bacterium]|nr:ankyrin repeat domain-containing protein [Cyanobacteriota bacterium]
MNLTQPPLHEAVWSKDVAQVQALLDAGTDPDQKNSGGRTPLMAASGLGLLDIVNLLLERGADVNILDNVIGISALHLAAQGGNVGVAATLLKAGAPINLQCHTNGMTALWSAVWYRQVDMVAFLLEQESISPYINADIRFSPRELITFGVDTTTIATTNPLRAEQIKQMTALFDAYDQRLAAKKSAQKIYAAIGNFDGKLTAEEQIETVRQLIAAGEDVNVPSPIESTAFDGQTPLLFAATMGQTEVVKMLLEAGADLHAVDAFMLATPIHKSCYMQHADVVEVLAQHKDFAEVVDAQGPYNGYTALHDSLWQGSLKAAKILIESGIPKLDLIGHDGNTPLDMAIKFGYDEIADLLRQKLGLSS